MKIVFLGSKSLGLQIFAALQCADAPGEWHVVHPDDQDDTRSVMKEFHNYATQHDIPFSVVGTQAEANSIVSDIAPDAAFACGWYWILPAEILESVPKGCFGLHNSILPKYRGWSPLVWSILNGDEEVGASVFKFSTGIDDGDILHQVRIKLNAKENISHALSRIGEEMIATLPKKWNAFLSGEVLLQPQAHDLATYCGRRIPTDGKINWNDPAPNVHNFIRAQASPYPGAFFYTQADQKIMIEASELIDFQYLGTPGQILEIKGQYAVVSCGQHTALRILEIRVDNHVVPIRSFLKSTTQRLL